MATLIDPDFRARLNALNDKYAAGVPALMTAIGAALDDCVQQGPQVANLAVLQKHLHTVAGSAATFGFTVLGHQCRDIEQRLRSMTARDGVAAASAVDHAGWLRLADDTAQLLRWAAVNPKAETYAPPAV